MREQAIAALGRNGRLTMVGLANRPITLAEDMMFSYFQRQLRGHYGSEPAHVSELISLQRAHRVEFSRSVSAVLPLADAAKAVHALESKLGNPIRIVLTP